MGIMKYVTLAALAAAGLALAGCGGGSKKPVAMGNQQMEMTDAQKAQAAYDAAAAAETAAMTARKTAEDQLAAVKKAVEPPQFARQLYYTGGDSSVVRTNAALVAAAKAAADKALADAKTALTAAEKALTDLNALPAGTTGLAAQKKVVTGQIETVKAEIKAIEKTLTGAGTIGDYFSRMDTEAELKDRAGETLATAGFDNATSSRPARRMLNSLSPRDTARSGSTRTGGYDGKGGMNLYNRRPTDTLSGAPMPPRKVIATTPTGGTTADLRSMFYHKYDDGELPAGVMTWEQIAAKDGMLVKKAFGTDNMDVDVLPLAGMPLSALTNSSGTGLTAYPTDISGDQYYKGVKGTLYCQGTCNAPGGKLTGKLFFKAADEFDDGYAGSYRYYWITPRNSHYTTWNAYVRYGYWLYGTGETTGISVMANSPARYRGDYGKSTTLPNTATYKGEAFGLSALKLYTAGEHTGQKTARFTADVTLNAKFGNDPKIEGKIDNFKGNAVDEKWSVKLAQTKHVSFDAEGLATGSSGSTAFDKPGSWQGNPFSQDGVGRPAGYMGAFNTHFPNGSAAGAFSTRIQAPAE